MVLSANDLGIHPNLVPVTCVQCGYRIGWIDDMDVYALVGLRCDDCSRIGNYQKDVY